MGGCTLGSILVGANDIGICAIALGDSSGELLQQFQTQFCKATLLEGGKNLETHVQSVVEFVEAPSTGLALPLDVRGTAFQVTVWEALQETHPGQTVTYSQLARRINKPNGARAVASACAKNRIALAIPCHRVVRTDNSPSGYRWGLQRKQAMLKREGIGSTI